MGDTLGSRGTTLTPRLIAIITELEKHQAVFQRAANPEDIYLYQLSAAHRVSIYEPFTTEQTALNDFLFRIQAGKALTQKAWALYAEALQKD